MQVTRITFLPLEMPSAPPVPRSLPANFSGEFHIAEFDGTVMSFEHKMTLTNGGRTVQIMTQDTQGEFTEALPENAFSIDDDFLGIEMLDPVTINGVVHFSVRLFTDSNTQNQIVPGTLSQVVLPDFPNNNLSITLVEARHDAGGNVFTTLNFIGATDIRAGYTRASVIIEPGEIVYLKCNSQNDLIFQF